MSYEYGLGRAVLICDEEWAMSGNCSNSAPSFNATKRVLFMNAVAYVTPPPYRLFVGNASGCQGHTVPISLTRYAQGATFGWRKNQVPIGVTQNPSAATATLTLTNIQPSDAGSYDCIVTNACGIVASNPATLDVYASCVVNPPLTITAGVSDAFLPGNGLEIGTPRAEFAAHLLERSQNRPLLPFDVVPTTPNDNNRIVGHSFTNLPGDITAATVEFRVRAGEDNGGEASDAYRVGQSFSATDFQGYQPRLGNSFGSPSVFNFPWVYWVTDPRCDQTVTSPDLDQYIIDRMNTLGYLDFMLGDDSGVDYVTLHATRSVTTGDTVAWAGPIAGPESACLGQSYTMTVAAGGTNRTYQWLKFGSPISPANNPSATTQSLVIPNFQVSDGGVYSCVVSNTFQTQTSPPFVPVLNGPSCTPLDCSPPTITTQPPDRATCVGQTVTFATAATSTAPGTIRYQWRQDGVSIDPAINPSAATATLLVQVASNLQSGVYDCQIVTGSGCGFGSTRLATLSVGGPACTPACVPPVVTTQPAGRIVCPGEPATLAVAATGTGTVTYRWKKDGVLISTARNPSAATATLRIPEALSPDRGSYTCMIADSGGCAPVSTQAAVLLVGGSACGVYAWDSADFNRDGVRNAADLAAYDAVIAGQPCPNCGDTDVNNDGVVNADDRQDFSTMSTNGSTGGGGAYSQSNYAISAPGLASPADSVPCESWNSGTVSFKYQLPEFELPIHVPVPVSLTLSPCLENNSVSYLGATSSLTRSDGTGTVSIETTWADYDAGDDAIPRFRERAIKGTWDWDGSVSIQPCPLEEERVLAQVRGRLYSYTFNIGEGGYRTTRLVSAFRACDSLVITLDQPANLELPLHVEGSVTAAESFGDINVTKATAELSLRGTLGGTGIPERKISVESISAIPVIDSINEHLAIPMSFTAGTTTVPIDFTGLAIVETTAKSAGLWGMLSAAATAIADYPDTIEVGMVRGLNNTPLPPGVLIVSQRTGAVLADTRVNFCVGDYNRDEGVDGDDLIAFFADWDNSFIQADMNRDGGVDGDDIIVFLSRWDAGC